MGSHINTGHTHRASGETQQILDSIRIIVQDLRVSSRAIERRFRISGAQLFVLQRLAESGKASSLNELAERTLTHQSSVSVVVEKLVREGLIRKAASPEDRRRIVLSLTPRGRATVNKAPLPAQHRLIRAVKRLSGRKRKLLASLLAQVTGAISADQLPPPLFFESPASRRQKKSDEQS